MDLQETIVLRIKRESGSHLATNYGPAGLQRTTILRAKRESLEKAFSSDFFRKSDEDLKMIGVSSIDSCLVELILMKKGLEKSQLQLEGAPMIRRVKILLRKLIKVGLKRSKL